MPKALPEPFSIHGGAVHFKGRAVKGAQLDAKTFEVLGPSHVRDETQVLLVLETKLKPIKRAIAATFRVLGASYGTDGQTVFFREKAVRLKKGPGTPGTFRELDLNYGTDGHWMYFGSQQAEPPSVAAFDWSAARMRPFEVNAVNRADAVLTDGTHTLLWRWGGEWLPLVGAQFDSLHRLGEDLAGNWRHAFVSDGERVWFEGQRLEGIDAASARVVGHSVIEDSAAVYCGLHRLDGVPGSVPGSAPGDLRWVEGDLYRTREALIRLKADALRAGAAPEVIRGEAPKSVEVTHAFAALVDRALPFAFTVFDRFLPVEANLDDVDFDVPPPAGVPAFTVRAAEGGQLELRAEGHVVVGLPSAWLSMLARLWSLLRGRSDGFPVYVSIGTMHPDADGFSVRLARRVVPELIGLSAALQAAGQSDEALAATHLVLSRADILRGRSDPDEETLRSLCQVPWEFVDAARYGPLAHRVDVTTNLAVAKYLVKGDWLSHGDLRSRWDAANLLNGVLLDSNKTKAMLAVVLEPLLERTQHEPVGILRELFWTALDSAAVALTVGADIGRAFEYELLETVTKALIAGGVNVSINRVRLVEALFGQARDDEAEALIQELALEDGDDPWPTPGPYAHRERFPSLAAAAKASRERARRAPRF